MPFLALVVHRFRLNPQIEKENSQRTFLSSFLQSKTHGRMQRVNVRLILHNLRQQILRLPLPVALCLYGISRALLILLVKTSVPGRLKNTQTQAHQGCHRFTQFVMSFQVFFHARNMLLQRLHLRLLVMHARNRRR